MLITVNKIKRVMAIALSVAALGTSVFAMPASAATVTEDASGKGFIGTAFSMKVVSIQAKAYDINGDGRFDVKDRDFAQNTVINAGVTIEENPSKRDSAVNYNAIRAIIACDYNNNGVIDSEDAQRVINAWNNTSGKGLVNKGVITAKVEEIHKAGYCTSTSTRAVDYKSYGKILSKKYV